MGVVASSCFPCHSAEDRVEYVSSLPTLLGRSKSDSVTKNRVTQIPFDGHHSNGLGKDISGVNHIALVVDDIGRSLFFYSQVVGFEQIDRPNFDRHGAWLSMGNIQLHLIKGVPPGRSQCPDDLNVSHIAVGVQDPMQVLQSLKRLQKVEFEDLMCRHNISVLESNTLCDAKSQDKFTQFLLEDPDGYWIKICRCGFEEAQHNCVVPNHNTAIPLNIDGSGYCNNIPGVNHVALVVDNLARSLFFYSQVIGFRHLDHPNFDRHEAWVSMGNLELHLIKGVPRTRKGQHPDDLIVSHIALDVRDPKQVLQSLRRLQKEQFEDLMWRQNISVPNSQTSFDEKFERHMDSKGKLTQFFLEDPDGYWIEICDCGHEEQHKSTLAHRKSAISLNMCTLSKLVIRTRRWARRACQNLAKFRFDEQQLIAELTTLEAVPRERVDSKKLLHLSLRRNTFGDPCQGLSDDEICSALARAGNDVPGALLLLVLARQASGGTVLIPPAFLDHTGKLHPTRALSIAN